jgi:Integrase zinc binding domain
MPSVYNLVKYDGSEVLSKGAALISTNEVEQLEWQQRGGVFILHKTAESTVLALRAVRQARAAAVTRATSAVGDKAQQGNKDLRPAAQRELKKHRVAVDVEQCAWWAVAVEGSSSSNGGSFPPYINRPNVWGLNNDGLSGYTSKGLKRGADNDKVQGQDNLLCSGVHSWTEGGSGEQAVGEQPHKALLATVTAAGEKPSPSWDAPDGVDLGEWAQAQRADAALVPWFDYLELQRLPKERSLKRTIEREVQHFKLQRGEGDGAVVLVHLSQRAGRGVVVQLVVPSGLRRRVLCSCHDSRWCGHVGPDKTLARTRIIYWWAGQADDCLQYCRSCIQCQQRKRPWSKQQARLHWPVSRPFQRVAMDLLDIQIDSSDGSRYVMVVHEYFTGWKYLFALQKKDPLPVAQCLAQVIGDHGSFEELLSDFGGEFINEVNTALVTKFGTRRLRTSPYHPQTDGAVERSNAVVLEMLTQLAAVHKKDWHEHLLSVALLCAHQWTLTLA